MTDLPGFAFDNSYARALDGLYLRQQAAQVPAPELVWLNRPLCVELGLDADALDSPEGAAFFSGNAVPAGADPLAQAYAGHQFGGFSPQLGDGRALLLGEVIDISGNRRDIQLKGSGRTPFSRNGDGKAAIGPVLREVLIGEAMFGLGIPTTRALAAVLTGENVRREDMLPGAVLTRVAASHIRVGTFQFFAARGDLAKLRKLADYAIARHYPDAAQTENPPLAFLDGVIARQAALIAKWMHVGFIHGVMNTDNMAVSGETIDYGPCAFLDRHDPAAVFSSIDRQGRYAYGAQPSIALWNLTRLAESLLALIDKDEAKAIALAQASLDRFAALFRTNWLAGMRAKLGLHRVEEGDQALADDFLVLLAAQGADHTLAFRRLADAVTGNDSPLRDQLVDPKALEPWLSRWQARSSADPRGPATRAAAMNGVNPVYIARNHKVEEALSAATNDRDYRPLRALLAVLADPFTEQPGLEPWAEPDPDGLAGYQTFCGT